jgi:hypothetical protein
MGWDQPNGWLVASEAGEVNPMGNNSGNHQTTPEDILNAQELVEDELRPAAESEKPGLSIPPGHDQPRNPAGDKPVDSPDRPIGDKPAVPGDEDKVA